MLLEKDKENRDFLILNSLLQMTRVIDDNKNNNDDNDNNINDHNNNHNINHNNK